MWRKVIRELAELVAAAQTEDKSVLGENRGNGIAGGGGLWGRRPPHGSQNSRVGVQLVEDISPKHSGLSWVCHPAVDDIALNKTMSFALMPRQLLK